MNRVARIMDRIQEIRTRFHMDAPSPTAFGQGAGSFAHELQQASQNLQGVGRVQGAERVLKPYAAQPAAGAETLGLRGARLLPGVPGVQGLQPQTGTPQTGSSASPAPPPLPALPFDAGLEPYLPSMNNRPRGAAAPAGQDDPLARLSEAARQFQTNRFLGLQGQNGLGGSLDAVSNLLLNQGTGQNGAIAPDLSTARPSGLVDLYRQLGSWEQALKVYNGGSAAQPQCPGVPIIE